MLDNQFSGKSLHLRGNVVFLCPEKLLNIVIALYAGICLKTTYGLMGAKRGLSSVSDIRLLVYDISDDFPNVASYIPLQLMDVLIDYLLLFYGYPNTASKDSDS